MEDVFEEDRDLRTALAALGPSYLRELEQVLSWPEDKRGDLSRSLIAKPGTQGLATLLAMADEDPTVRLRLLRAIRDIGSPLAPNNV